MFNKLKRYRRKLLRFVRLVWRDQEAMSVIWLPIGAIGPGLGAGLSYVTKGYVVAMIDSMLAGVLFGFAIFVSLNLFRRQSERERFIEWAKGVMAKLTEEANAAIAAEHFRHAGDDDDERPQRTH